MKLKRLTAAELARRAQITRQAISKWKLHPEGIQPEVIHASVQTVQKIAQALDLSPAELMHDPFKSLTSEHKRQYTALLLWDHLYDSIESFILALAKKEYRAVARYVQVFGILRGHKIFGAWIYDRLPHYAAHLHPIKRKELIQLCQTLRLQNLI